MFGTKAELRQQGADGAGVGLAHPSRLRIWIGAKVSPCRIVNCPRLAISSTAAKCAAVALRRALLDDGGGAGDVEHYEHSYRAWLDYVNDHLIAEPGRWIRAGGRA